MKAALTVLVVAVCMVVSAYSVAGFKIQSTDRTFMVCINGLSGACRE